jgi:hypothetical protein
MVIKERTGQHAIELKEKILDTLGGNPSAYMVFQENNEIIYLKNCTSTLLSTGHRRPNFRPFCLCLPGVAPWRRRVPPWLFF